MMATEIELVYFSGCPHVDDARGNLTSALQQLGRDPAWQEWDLDDSEAPDRVRGFVSPTVLIGGVHLFGDQRLESRARACSASGAPAASAIVEAIRRAS